MKKIFLIIFATLLGATTTFAKNSCCKGVPPGNLHGNHENRFIFYVYDKNYNPISEENLAKFVSFAPVQQGNYKLGPKKKSIAGFDNHGLPIWWVSNNQINVSGPMPSCQVDNDNNQGVVDCCWCVGRHKEDETQTYMQQLLKNGVTASLTIWPDSSDKNSTAYTTIPKNLNFGWIDNMYFNINGKQYYLDFMLGQTGKTNWNQFDDDMKKSIKNSIYAEATDGMDVEADAVTVWDWTKGVVEVLIDKKNIWSISLNMAKNVHIKKGTQGEDDDDDDDDLFPALNTLYKDAKNGYGKRGILAYLRVGGTDTSAADYGKATQYSVMVRQHDKSSDHQVDLILLNMPFACILNNKPEGSYAQSCRNIKMENGTLSATCDMIALSRDPANPTAHQTKDSSLDYCNSQACLYGNAQVSNNDGNLVCEATASNQSAVTPDTKKKPAA